MSATARPVAPHERQPITIRARQIGALLTVSGLIGLIAASVLLVEKLRVLRDPSYVPSCSINPILNCGSVMNTPQAEALGFPNPILGIAGFSMLVAVGVALLGGFEPPRWFWLGVQAGVTAGAAFVHWLIFQSLYRIGALCPYCMVVWAVTIPVFVYTTLRNLEAGCFVARQAASRASRVLIDNHGILLTGWVLVIIGLIAERFWDYWTSLTR